MLLLEKASKRAGKKQILCLADCPRLIDSLDGKAARLLNGLRQLFVHLLVRRVRRQIEPVEACVRLGQVLHRGVDQVDGEQSRTGGARRTFRCETKTVHHQSKFDDQSIRFQYPGAL